MKYGQIPIEEVEAMDLSLPADHPDTAKALAATKSDDPPAAYVGCAKWGIDSWVGTVYPEGTKKKDYLDAYKDHFNSIELNTTFYSMKPDYVRNWTATVGDKHFKFCPKWPRRVSHLKRLKVGEDDINFVVDTCGIMGEHLGQSLVQMPENFGPKNFERLQDFVKLLPAGFPVQIELRHADWFVGDVYDETAAMLHEHGVGFVITDTCGRRDAIHQRLTNGVAFVRFNGNIDHPTDFTRVEEWAERFAEWISQGCRELYFFPHQGDEGVTPNTCKFMIEQLNEKAGLDLELPF